MTHIDVGSETPFDTRAEALRSWLDDHAWEVADG
jgi:hypothetical protein